MHFSKRSLKAIWQLLRLEHGLMYGLGVLVGIFLGGGASFELILLGFLTALFFQASTFAMNDYLDYDVDVENRRMDRPLARGDLSKRTALTLSILFFPLGCLSSFLISFEAFLFATTVSILGHLYNFKLKELGILGNFYIAFTMAAPFIFGGIISNLGHPTLFLSSIAFFCGFGREVMKGIEDVKGDAIRKVRSVARVYGTKFAAKISSIFFSIAILLSFFPPMLFEEYYDVKYIVPVFITDLLILNVILSLRKSKDIAKFRKLTLVAMIFGLLGFLGGAF
ncbi:MAG: UbiA family prenyltransferase [Archaeoglobaceae archaeon]